MKIAPIFVVLVLSLVRGEAAIVIDLDVGVPGIQTTRQVSEGQELVFAVVATSFTGPVHCFNGLGIDVSFRGSMTGVFGSEITPGDVATYATDGFSKDLAFRESTAVPGMSLKAFGTGHDRGFVEPLLGYTSNIGGVGMLDPPDNNIGSPSNHVVTYTNVPDGQVFFATILTATITLTNTEGNTYELFPSGIIINPATISGTDGESLTGSTTDPFTNFTIAQGGDVLLHSELHGADPNCTNPGFDSFQGAGVDAVPEPSVTSLLIGAIALLVIGRRRNSVR